MPAWLSISGLTWLALGAALAVVAVLAARLWRWLRRPAVVLIHGLGGFDAGVADGETVAGAQSSQRLRLHVMDHAAARQWIELHQRRGAP